MATMAGGLRRRTALSVVVALAATALIVGSPSPANASYYETGVSFSHRILRDATPYWLNVKAIESMGFEQTLEVTISKTRDPSGPTVLRQRQTWVFDMEQGDFTMDGNRYAIDAGSSEGPFHVNLVIERRQDERCGRDQALFVTQPEGGAFRIETGNETFGTITEVPECGTTYDYSSGQVPGPPRCPLAGDEIWSDPLTVKEGRDNEVARVMLHKDRQREVAAGHQVEWFVRVAGFIPAERFRLDAELEGSFRSGGAPWLDGRARFKPSEAVARIDWYECRGDREALTFERAGALTGDLTLDVIGYDIQRITDQDALARRSRVRRLP